MIVQFKIQGNPKLLIDIPFDTIQQDLSNFSFYSSQSTPKQGHIMYKETTGSALN